MTRSDWSTADELGWREAARWWFLARGVEANLAEDLTQEALLRLLRGQQRGQPLTRAYLHRVCQSVLYDHLRQCAREFYKDTAHKAGTQRRELDITPCFAALLRWIVRLWTPPHKCLALALDATTLKQRFTVLSISVLYQHRAIPVAWTMLPPTR